MSRLAARPFLTLLILEASLPFGHPRHPVPSFVSRERAGKGCLALCPRRAYVSSAGRERSPCMNRAISVVLLALAPALSFAQEKPAETKPAATAETRLPLADEVLDKYVEALGGKAAVEKLTSRVMKGDFELTTMGVTSVAEIYAKAPNKWLLTINVPGFGLVQQGYDGASGWAQDPQTGLRDLRGGELEDVKRSAEFNQPLKLK